MRGHRGENTEEKDADLHKVGGRHVEGLVDPNGAAEDVGAADQGQIGGEETQAGEPRLPRDVAPNRSGTGPGLGGDLHGPASRRGFRVGQVGRLGARERGFGVVAPRPGKNIKRSGAAAKGD